MGKGGYPAGGIPAFVLRRNKKRRQPGYRVAVTLRSEACSVRVYDAITTSMG